MHVTPKMKRALANDGVIAVRGLFAPPELKRVRESFEYGISHPSPYASQVFKGTDDAHFNDSSNPKNTPEYLAMIRELGLHDFVASLWDSEHVWFLGEEIFVKSGGKSGRSPWHQDTSYLAANGDH